MQRCVDRAPLLPPIEPKCVRVLPLYDGVIADVSHIVLL